MRLLIIRHAPAGDAADFARSGLDDDLRPVTPEGKVLMSAAAEGLARIVPRVDRFISSPLVRAVQTAEVVTAVFDRMPFGHSDLLRPDAPIDDFPDLLADAPADSVVAIFGHRPHLHRLAAWLLTADEDEFLAIKKGGALQLKFPAKRGLRRGRGKLEWSLTPEQLSWIGQPAEPRGSDD